MLKLIKIFKRKEWSLVIISFLFIVCQVWLDLKLPDYRSKITKLVKTEGSKMSDILTNGGYMLLCALGSLIAAILVGYLISNLASTFSMKVRKKLFNKVENLNTDRAVEIISQTPVSKYFSGFSKTR